MLYNNFDDYDDIYFDEDEVDYDEIIEEYKGTISEGTCLYCGHIDGMKYVGNTCFICDKCGKSVHEDTYYIWAAGYDIEFED